jgi:hypothetical protein
VLRFPASRREYLLGVHKMTTQKDTRFHDWAKARLDEMDATVTSLEAEAGKLSADARKNAQAVVVKMREQRDAFSNAFKKQEKTAEDAWAKTKAALESEWKGFETSLQEYFDKTREQSGHRIAVFRASAEAQRKTWEHAIEEIRKATVGLASEEKAHAEAAMKRMKADATAAKAMLDALGHAGAEAWSDYKVALTTTRAAFDSAAQAAQKAFKRAV